MRPLIVLQAIACISLHGGLLHAAELPLANEALLHSARLWEANQRGDLALLALKKLVAARPDAPQALQELGELALRMDDMDTAAWVLEQLNRHFSKTSYARDYAQAYRLQTTDRLRLASLQRLIELGRTNEARAEMTRLFPDGAPRGYLSIQYYNLLARLPGTWQRVFDGLQALSIAHPDEPRYRFALARHLLRRDDTTLQGLHMLNALTERDDVRTTEVDDALIVALKILGPQSAPPDLVRAYARRHPEDAEAQRLLYVIEQHERATQQWWRQALLTLQPDAQPTDATQVQTMLAQLRSANQALDDAVQSWYALDRETPPPADASLNSEVDHWRALGVAALRAGRMPEAHLNFRIALALKQLAFENTIALADELQAAARNEESGALLHSAMQFAPQSTWLFETYLRWLIAQNRAAEALALLDNRTPGDKFTAASRNALRASALQQRATSGDAAQAVLDFEQALALTPDDVWLRYRLANAYAAANRHTRGTVLMDQGAALLPHNADMRYAQALFLASIDEHDAALAALHAIAEAQRTPDMLALQQRLVRTRLRMDVDALLEQQRVAEAAARLDELIALTPDDRGLHLWRAELELSMNRPQAARDRLALLVAEDQDDLDARLAYVRALIDSGDVALARLQLQAAQELARPDDVNAQLTIAYRAWSLDDAAATSAALQPVLAQLEQNADAWLLAARSELAQRHYARAHQYLEHAAQLNAPASTDARSLRLELEQRLQSSLTSALLTRHKPGDAGVSRFDSITLANAFDWPLDYEHRLTLRADAVSLSAGELDTHTAELFGTRYLNANAEHRNVTQLGVALGLVHRSDLFNVDIGTTPLGFLLPNVVGGIAWTPPTQRLDLTIGVERRAVTSSVLSFAGMRDPASGVKWGGVLATGPYVQAGRYGEVFNLSGSLRVAHIAGEKVLSNRFIGARIAGDWRWFDSASDRAWLGITLNYWNYQRNLQGYTLGSGGYYSPQSYVSIALPVEWQGRRYPWSYQVRAALAYNHSRTDRAAWFPTDAALQQQAAALAQVKNDGDPYFSSDRGSGTSFSAAARLERALAKRWVIGGEFSLDRSDYYHPVELNIYLRHAFGGELSPALPPRPLRPYND